MKVTKVEMMAARGNEGMTIRKRVEGEEEVRTVM